VTKEQCARGCIYVAELFDGRKIRRHNCKGFAHAPLALAQARHQTLGLVRRLAPDHRVDHVCECGPGRVLGGLVGRIDGTLQMACLATPEHLRSAVKSVQESHS